MATMLGIEVPLIPLTSEVFGKSGDRVLHGAVSVFSRGSYDLCDMCLQTENHEFFIHPTLFSGILGDPNTICWVQITLSDGKLRMQARQRWDKKPAPDAEVIEAEPAKLAHTVVDNVIDFVAAIARQPYCANKASCKGAKRRELDIRRSALVMRGSQCVVLCSRCFREELKRDPGLSERVVLDGRRIPWHSPVPIWE